MTRRILIAAAVTWAAGSSMLSAADSSRDIRKTFSLNANGRLSIDTYKGSVRVTAWDKPQVEVEVRIEADGWSLGRDRDMVQDIDVDFTASAASVRMKTRYPKRDSGSWFESSASQPLVHYNIHMPRNAELRIKDYKSRIDLDGISAGLDLETYKGDVRVSYAKYIARSSFSTYKGTCDINVPNDSRFEIVSEVGRRGTVNSSFQMIMPAGSRKERGNFRATINGGGPAMVLQGYRGEFRIR